MPELAGPRSMRQLLDAVMTVGTDLDLPAMLRRIIQAAADLVDARYGALGVLNEEGTALAQFIVVGVDDETHAAIGELPKGHGILGLLIRDAKPLRLPDLGEHPDSFGFPPNHPEMHSFLGVPIVLRDEVFGNLYLTEKKTAEVFTDIDEELVVALASAAAVAIENARLHARVQDFALVEDRERIARDLHDTVIQRLFATGLSLQGTVRLAKDPTVTKRLEQAVEELDLTVRHIRTAIFGLEASREGGHDGLRSRILHLTTEASRVLGFDPRVLFEGPVDATVPPNVADDLVATVREALSNVGRHAAASHVELMLRSDGGEVSLEVRDDGVGPPAEPPMSGSGLSNMAARAARYGGAFALSPGPTGGSILRWSAPIEA